VHTQQRRLSRHASVGVMTTFIDANASRDLGPRASRKSGCLDKPEVGVMTTSKTAMSQRPRPRPTQAQVPLVLAQRQEGGVAGVRGACLKRNHFRLWSLPRTLHLIGTRSPLQQLCKQPHVLEMWPTSVATETTLSCKRTTTTSQQVRLPEA
jgi:hypothetical protein